MLILRILLLILIWRVASCVEFSFTKNANNYGPYVMHLKKYEECRGPKATNASTMSAEVFRNETSVVVTYNMKFHVDIRMTEMKINVWNVNGLQKTVLWNYKVDKPCQHYAITSAMSKHLPLQPNCVIRKGNFTFAVNFTAVAHQFFGDSFFYGEFLLKVVNIATQGNIMCVYLGLVFEKQIK